MFDRQYLEHFDRVYATWEEIKIIIMSNEKGASYKGFYSLEEAFTAV